MSVYSRTYVCRLAPCSETWRDAMRRGHDVIVRGEMVRESFAPDAFRRVVPTSVPVVLSHEKERPVGVLTGLTTSSGWHIGAFTLDHSLTFSDVAIDRLRIGAPVSANFTSVRRDPVLAEDGFAWYQDALLNEVSILAPDEYPAFRGAEITSILERSKSSTADAEIEAFMGKERHAARGADSGLLIRRGVGQILGVR